MEISNEIKRQTDVVLNFLKKSEPFILKKKFVPVPPEVIDEYLNHRHRIIPPDFYYWLTHVGAGTVYFLSGSLDIPTIQEIINNETDGRLYDNSPKNCFKRITLDYLGTPSIKVIDSLVIDEHGCAPVIQTTYYGDLTGEIFSSSWPMYVLNQAVQALRRTVNELNTSGEATNDKLREKFNFQDDTEKSLVKLGLELCLSHTGLDTKLNDAALRSIANNNTTNNEEETEEVENMFKESLVKITGELLDLASETYEVPPDKKYNLKELIEKIEKNWETFGRCYIDFIDHDFSKSKLTELLKVLHESQFRLVRESIVYELNDILSDEEKLTILKPIYNDENEFDLELKSKIHRLCSSVEGFLD